MSHSNVSKGMSSADVNSEGKPYHEHGAGDKIEKKQHEPAAHPESKDHTPHGHNNQFHKDIKGSAGSGTSELGDHKAEKESS